MIDYATFQRIQHLHRVEQLTVAQIALAMAMDARTVRRWLDEPQFRARATPARPSKLDPYKAYIRRLLEHHPYSAAQLLNRLREAGYRRIPRVGERPAHLEVFEHEAAVVRRIFDDYVHKDLSMRQIAKGLNYDGISSPSGRAVWGVSTIARILRNEAYIGRVYANRTEAVLDRRLAGKTRQVPRPRDQWIAIAVPAALDEERFEAAQRVSRDNSQWSPRRAESGYWLLRGLVKCGHCAMSVSCHKMRGRNGTFHRYYYCRNHDPLRAGGEHRRCPGRNIRSDELDAFVFEQARDALLRPDVLLSGEHAVSARREPAADELLQAQLAKLQRKIDAVAGERRRLADL